jgi:hypothetical protein
VKKILIVLALLVMVIAGWYINSNESLPRPVDRGISSVGISPADALANKMLKAIHKEEWDAIRYVQWTFRDKRHFLWDKYDHLVQVEWDDHRVVIDPNTSLGIAYQNDVLQEASAADALIHEAIDAFNNDSFWLNAPAKIYDEGTERSIVDHHGQDALMVKYNSGGSTPGDSYLWILDENALPKSWKMWVSNIPIGGMELTWEEWTDYSGAKLAQLHKGGVFDLRISNIKTGMNLADLGLAEDVFTVLR